MPFNPYSPGMPLGPLMPQFDIERLRQQAYGQSPSGPGPYHPPVRRQVPDLQPYTGLRPPIDTGYLFSPSGPYGASRQLRPAPPQSQPASAGPLDFAAIMRKLAEATAAAGVDPAGFGQVFGQRQPRTIQTTDPGAGYGMSPSGPTAQMPTRQQPTFRSVSHRPLGPGDFPRPSSPPGQLRNPVTKPKPMSPFFEPFGGDPYIPFPLFPPGP